jgi:HK97 family phage portal protein
MANQFQRLATRLIFGGDRARATKALYDLHPELANRQPIARWTSDGDTALGEYLNAASDYEGHVWVRKAIDTIARNLAQLQLEVVQGPAKEPVAGHPLTALFAHVNDAMAGPDLWTQWAVNMMLGGEVGFELVKNQGGKYREIWPRQSQDYAVRVEKERKRYQGVVGYRIDDNLGDPYTLPPDEFQHFKLYNPMNVWRGLAPLTAIRIGLRIDQYAQAWARQFFANQARPDFAIISPQGLTQTERDELLASLTRKHGDLEDWHKPIVLEEGVTDIKAFSYPPRDIEWLEQRKLARDEIGAIFGVPDELLGFGRNTYENFGQAFRVLWQLTLMPLILMRDTWLTEFWRTKGQLLTPQQAVRTDTSQIAALQADMGDKVTQAGQLWAMGAPFNQLNAALKLGIGDVPGGDQGYLPLTLMPVDQRLDLSARAQPTGTTPPPGAAVTPGGMIVTGPGGIPMGIEPVWAAEEDNARYPFGSDIHKALWYLYKAKTDGRIRGMKRLIRKRFQEEQNDINELIRASDNTAQLTVADIYDRPGQEELWVEAMLPFTLDTVEAGADHALEQLGRATEDAEDGKDASTLLGSFDIHNPQVVAAIQEIAWQFVWELTGETQAQLEGLLELASTEGWSVPKLSEELTALYSGFKGVRTNKAFNLGSQWLYESENVEKRGWLSALDARTRTEVFDHVSAHDEEQPMGKPFLRTGEALMYPGDPNGSPGNIINCRCTIYPVVEL